MKHLKLLICLVFVITAIQAHSKDRDGSEKTKVSQQAMDDNSPNEKAARPNVIPPSPQAETFENYINHEVSGPNGLPDINIPLYTIELKGMQIPISLTYHASGIKYKQYDGEVGAGWSLTAGGYRVSRTIYGRADERYPLFSESELKTNLESGSLERDSYLSSIVLSEGSSHQLIIQNKPNKRQDGEYDQFTYMLPSTNGKFIISDRGTKEVKLINLDQIKIDIDPGLDTLLLNKMTITDNAGNIYLLGDKKYIEASPDDKTLNTSWLLSNIRTPYGENVDFEYLYKTKAGARNENYLYTLYDVPINIISPIQLLSPPVDVLSSSYSTSEMGYISRITTDKLIVEFSRRNSDGLFVSPLIEDISIKDKFTGQVIKRIKFNYETSPKEANIKEQKFPWHTLLQSVQVGNELMTESQNYSFKYYDSPSARDTKMYPDQWGYYKESASDLVGDAVLHNELGELEFVSIKTLNIYNTDKISSAQFQQNTATFQNRSRSGGVPDFFSLKEITFPTGGKTQYEYESHSFKIKDKTFIGGGLRIKKIVSTDSTGGEPVITEYSYGKNEDGIGFTNGSITDYYPDLTWCFANETYYFYQDGFRDYTGNLILFPSLKTIRTLSSKPLFPEFDNLMHITYPEYTTRQYTGDGGYNGKTIFVYDTPPEMLIRLVKNDFNFKFNSPLIPKIRNFKYDCYVKYKNLGTKPLLSRKDVFDKSGKLVYRDSISYKVHARDTFPEIKALEKVIIGTYNQSDWTNDDLNPYLYFTSLYSYDYSNTILYGTQPQTTITTQYSREGKDSVTTVKNFQYDDLLRTKRVIQENSVAGTSEQELTYPTTETALIDRNMVSTVIESVSRNNGTETSRNRNLYAPNSIWPQQIQSTGTAGTLKTDVVFTRYDHKGNPVEYTTSDGTTTVVIWGYGNTHPIAILTNTTYQQVVEAADAIQRNLINTLTSSTTPDFGKLSQLTKRPELADAQITTYRFKMPLGLLVEVTDPRGVSVYYGYDALNRLEEEYMRIQNLKQLTNTYYYHYTNQ